MFRNCPTWVPNSFFIEVDECVGAFIWWGGSLPRLARSTLLLVLCGRLALLDYWTYYWVAIIVTAHWWFLHSWANAVVCLEAVTLGSLQELGNLVHWGPQAYPNLPYPTRVMLRVWGIARLLFLQPHRWSPFCPLWGNPNLPHFRSLPDPELWAR